MTATPPAADISLSYGQSLAHGPLGTALLHVERARRGAIAWEEVHRSLSGTGPLIDGPDAGLYLGAPAMAFVLHLAANGTDRYAGALRSLDTVVAAHTRRRLAAAHERMNAGHATTFAEYDLLRGLTGVGALLLRRQPRGPETKGVLEYLVRLTEPTFTDGELRPGWWVGHAPTHQTAMPGGHANAGMAHGITGPLALLSLALRAGVTVDGHEAAIRRICSWLDGIRRVDRAGIRWPRWTSSRAAVPAFPAAPSWCYGTPGIARAQQLAAVVTEDGDRKQMAERALLDCLADPDQLDQVADRGLCHGFAGIVRAAQRVAEDAANPPAFADRIGALLQRASAAGRLAETGFLEGEAGAALTFLDAEPGGVAAPGGWWDACLLLT